MDLVNHESQPISPITSPRNTVFGTRVHSSSDANFPIIAIAIIGILATGFLLVSYYIFVIKCCLNWHRIDLLRRFSLSRNRRNEQALMVYSPVIETRGLDESVIRTIPVFQYKNKGENRDFCECAVCLNEFQEDEKLRIIPNCSHVFHIDCIDVWLQNNANCPLCRTSISSTARFQLDQITAPSSSPEDSSPYSGSLVGGDEEYVVIELGNRVQERMNSGDLSARSISSSSRKTEQRVLPKKPTKLHKKVTSMGDECIDIRNKDDNFAIQPIRRSFSMDSSADRQLCLLIQEIARQSRQVSEVTSPVAGCSSRARTTCFSFSHGRGSRNAVLPVHLEP
ncbi:RING/U-box superfamily protein [Tripterygium wilfordii]|uniref:RING-type E3 ubiquitin transferase n=1 Tax=Tripterygium wilfordii TaxID=458696 RepID=A0A7J7CS16_TRIWF|nr:RING-H2 finger protein ATL16-like [Tripterygium wilfordii]KAF5736759.1 RING/U-box superfamily protein [Tripterygium wilfordii]